MLRALISAAIVVAIALVALVVVAESQRSSDRQKNQNPPGKQWGQNTSYNESATQNRTDRFAAIQN